MIAEVAIYEASLDQRGSDEDRAWSAGVQLHAMGGPIIRVLTLPMWALQECLAPEAYRVVQRLGHDGWAFQVRQGFDAAEHGSWKSRRQVGRW